MSPTFFEPGVEQKQKSPNYHGPDDNKYDTGTFAESLLIEFFFVQIDEKENGHHAKTKTNQPDYPQGGMAHFFADELLDFSDHCELL